MTGQTPVAQYEERKIEDLPSPLTALIPVSLLTTQATQTLPSNRQIKGDALIGMRFGLPGARYEAYIKTNSDISFKIKKIDLDLIDVTTGVVENSRINMHEFFHELQDVIRDFGMEGIVFFDKMKEDPPFGIGYSIKLNIPTYCVRFKNPRKDWLNIFSEIKTMSYDPWESRRLIAEYAVMHPEKFDFFSIIPGRPY
jgi:hypothetical protein